ncbi:MAG: hypothetical protein H6732_20155 [Alphaproteobacteria bacterium]|nr:hypothetical protein [Alphaproteobacteria bacterium]
MRVLSLSKGVGKGAVLLASVVMVAGCPPTCGEACAKLDRCGLNDDVGQLECETACRRELAAYQDDGDTGREQAFDQQRWCIGQETCAVIEGGACYDDALFAFDAQPSGG